MAKIGNAVQDERGKSKGGKAGDQTGSEVRVQDWYNRSKKWSHVIRPLYPNEAEAIAKAMKQACDNKHIGYDQDQRTTLYFQARNYNWDISKITTDCECDCSSLVAVCCNAAGIQISKDMYTGNELELLKATGRFEILTDDKYLTSDAYLRRGDILLGTGHTAIVLSDGATFSLDMRELQKGDKGSDVKVLQAILSGYGYDPNGIDGVFGNGCQKAVKKFQKDRKLTSDGIAGKKTWAALLG